MRSSMIVVSVAAFLVGCATPAEQAAQAEREVEQMMQIYGPACEKLGFKANTDAWRNCVLSLNQKDTARYYGSAYYGPTYWRYPYWAY
ncbi:MAG: hypothetical protein ACREX0_06945 [Noviherbaspirillum sp.]